MNKIRQKTDEELKIEAVIIEAEEFVRRARKTVERLVNDDYASVAPLAERAAMRRQSLELTRALAYLRRR